MSSVALPEMRRYGYKGSFATGALAAGGTLGILIPPSIIMVIYSILTEQALGTICSWPRSCLASSRPRAMRWPPYIYVRISARSGAAGAERLPVSERIKSLGARWGRSRMIFVISGGRHLHGRVHPNRGRRRRRRRHRRARLGDGRDLDRARADRRG